MMTKFHHFYILKESNWPILASIMSMSLMSSILIFFKMCKNDNLMYALAILMLVSMTWWMMISKELSVEGKSTTTMEKSFKISMMLFILSEILFFMSMFWSYFSFYLTPTMEIGMTWPPKMMKSFEFMNIPMLNTLILLTSGVTITLSHQKILESKFKMMKLYLMLTLGLGIIFSLAQYMEYSQSFFTMADSTFGTTFFMLTGFHGMHIIIGSIYILISLKNLNKNISFKESLMFEMSSWYWHFVDVVWIFLFYSLYYLPN